MIYSWHLTMKKTIIILAAFLFSEILCAQTPADYIIRARALTKSGKAEEAVRLLSEAVRIHNDSRLYCEKAEAEIATGDLSAAIADFNTANSIEQYSGEYGLAGVYARKGDAATSMYHLEIFMKSPFRKSEKEIMLNPAFSRIENSSDWRKFWQKPWYPEIETRISEIEYYTSIGRIKDAQEILSDIRTHYQGNLRLDYASALVSFSSGKYPDAIKSLMALLDAHPENEQYLLLLASAQSGSSNYAGASDTYSKLLNMGIPDVKLYLKRAECYIRTGETKRALADIEKYLSFFPDDKDALSMAGRIESASGNNLGALRYYTENVRKNPGDPQCFIERANAYMSSKSWEWAANDFSMSLDLDPSNSEAWLNKGISLLNMGNNQSACRDFRQALKLGNRKATDYISKYCIR